MSCAIIPATRTTTTWSALKGGSSAACFGRSAMRAGNGTCSPSSGRPSPATHRRGTRRRRHSARRGSNGARGEADRAGAGSAASADVFHSALQGFVFALLLLPPLWRIVRVLRFAGRPPRAVRSRRRGAAARAWPRPRLIGRGQFGFLHGSRFARCPPGGRRLRRHYIGRVGGGAASQRCRDAGDGQHGHAMQHGFPPPLRPAYVDRYGAQCARTLKTVVPLRCEDPAQRRRGTMRQPRSAPPGNYGWRCSIKANGPGTKFPDFPPCDCVTFALRSVPIEMGQREKFNNDAVFLNWKRCGRPLGEGRPRRTRSGDGEGGDVTGPQTPVVAFTARATRRWSPPGAGRRWRPTGSDPTATDA